MSTEEELEDFPEVNVVENLVMLLTAGTGIALMFFIANTMLSAAALIGSYIVILWFSGFFEGALGIEENKVLSGVSTVSLYSWFYWWAIYKDNYLVGLGALILFVMVVATIKPMVNVIKGRKS